MAREVNFERNTDIYKCFSDHGTTAVWFCSSRLTALTAFHVSSKLWLHLNLPNPHQLALPSTGNRDHRAVSILPRTFAVNTCPASFGLDRHFFPFSDVRHSCLFSARNIPILMQKFTYIQKIRISFLTLCVPKRAKNMHVTTQRKNVGNGSPPFPHGSQ